MEKFLLVDESGETTCILDTVLSSSIKSAQKHFNNQGWMIGEVMSEADYIHERQQSQMEVSLELGEQ